MSSSITIANLSRMTRETLSSIIQTPTAASNLAIIDVRDSDHVGGNIVTSKWVPSSSFDVHVPELIRTLKDKEKVVFHCALSQQRGPSAALKYARERARVLGDEECAKQTIFVLDGGFVKWQEVFGNDPKLTNDYVKDIWEEY